MRFSQTQYIRFPSVTKLQYSGSELRRSFYGKFQTTIPTKTSSNDPQKKSFTWQDPKEFKIINVPEQESIMTIRTMEPPNNSNKQEQNIQRSAQKVDQKRLFKAKSITGLRFHIKKSIQRPKFIKINYSELYAQIVALINLSHGVAVRNNQFNTRVRRARIERGNNDLIIRQIIKNRTEWTIIKKSTQEQGLAFKSINMNKVNLNWTQNSQKKIAEQSVLNSMKAFQFIQQGSQEKTQTIYSFQRSFEKMLCQQPKILQLFFTEWQTRPTKLNEWIQKMKASHLITPQNLVIYNHLNNHECITSKKNLYYTLVRYYEKSSKNAFDKIPKTYHLTAFNWQHILHLIKAQPKDKIWLIKLGQNWSQGRGIQAMKNSKELVDKILLHPPKSEENAFIVQQYIRPMLYDARKFDIRCFILAVEVNQSIKFYWYEEGYLHTVIKKITLNNTFKNILMNNDAVHKRLSNQRSRDNVNNLSFHQLQRHMQEQQNINFIENVLSQIRSVSRDLCEAAAQSIGLRQGINFQIYGLDFLIDEVGKPWLIKVNANPSYDLGCDLLTKIIPQMLQNSFRLILDVFLPSARGSPDWAQQFIINNKYRLLHSVLRQSPNILKQF